MCHMCESVHVCACICVCVYILVPMSARVHACACMCIKWAGNGKKGIWLDVFVSLTGPVTQESSLAHISGSKKQVSLDQRRRKVGR